MTADQLAQRRELIHQKTQELYRERFEGNYQINFRDLWDFINKKLQNEGENTFMISSEPV